jgi:hypothetical protein
VADSSTGILRSHQKKKLVQPHKHIDISKVLDNLFSFSHFDKMPLFFPSQQNNHVTPLPTGYRFAMASVMDDAKKKGQDAK